jgi:hypothetical protein
MEKINRKARGEVRGCELVEVPLRSGGRGTVSVTAYDAACGEFPDASSSQALLRVQLQAEDALLAIERLLQGVPRDAAHLNEMFRAEMRAGQEDSRAIRASNEVYTELVLRRRAADAAKILAAAGRG